MTDTTPSNVILEIGSRVRAGVSVTYGDPVELDGATIVPVAAAAYSFGGLQDDAVDKGAGGGGSASVPLGAYVARNGTVRYEPNATFLAVLAVPVVWMVGRVIVKVLKSRRR